VTHLDTEDARARGDTEAGIFIRHGPLHSCMPKTLEVVCNDRECALDMFELHYTYDMPDGTGVEAFSCPYCGSGDSLEEIQV
jgi:hypothetical protein